MAGKEQSMTRAEKKELERVWGPAMEVELYIEAVNLKCLKMLVEAATTDYNNLCDLKKRNRSIRDRDLRHAKGLIEARVMAYERELARLNGEGQIDEEEAIIARLDNPKAEPSPEQIEERLASFVADEREAGGGDDDLNPLMPL